MDSSILTVTPVLQNPQIPDITHPHPSPTALHPLLSSRRGFIPTHDPFHPPLHPLKLRPLQESHRHPQSPAPHSKPLVLLTSTIPTPVPQPPNLLSPGPSSQLTATPTEPTQISGFTHSHSSPTDPHPLMSWRSFIPTHSPLHPLLHPQICFPPNIPTDTPKHLLDPTATSSPAGAHHSQPSPTDPHPFPAPQTSTPARRSPLSPS